MIEVVTDRRIAGGTRTARVVLFSCWLVASVSGLALAQTTVDTCGQTYSGDGVLVADLDCSLFPGFAVVIDGKGTLDLAGFTLSATEGVQCTANGGCTIHSSVVGGTIEGQGLAGFLTGVKYAANLVVSDITIRNFYRGTDGFGITASNVVFESNLATAIQHKEFQGGGKYVIEDCVFLNNGEAVRGVPVLPYATKAIIRRSTFSGNVAGPGMIRAMKLKFEDSTVSGTVPGAAEFPRLLEVAKAKIRNVQFDNNDGALTMWDKSRWKLEDVTITNSLSDTWVLAGSPITAKLRADRFSLDGAVGGGLTGRSMNLRDSTVANTGGTGVNAVNVKLQDSSVTGNAGAGVRVVGIIIVSGKGVVKRSQVTGNGQFGVLADDDSMLNCSLNMTARIIDSTVTGNATDADCGTLIPCADVAGCDPIKISGTTICDTSYQVLSGIPGTNWGICSLD